MPVITRSQSRKLCFAHVSDVEEEEQEINPSVIGILGILFAMCIMYITIDKPLSIHKILGIL